MIYGGVAVVLGSFFFDRRDEEVAGGENDGSHFSYKVVFSNDRIDLF